jgi:peroxiredoxin
MAIRDRHNIYWVTAAFCSLVLVLGVLHGCKRQKPSAAEGKSSEGVKALPVAAKEPAKSPLETAASLFREPKVSIQNIVKAANDRWTPACQDWWDKEAPDFTLTDVQGQTHKLSEYKGKDVVVVFWTTWYATCKKEASQWKELRAAFPPDKLAILAISNEPAALVKKAAEELGIDYTVLTSSGNLPAPFDKVETVPSSFFIGPDGRFKLAIKGMVPVSDSKAIVQAQ